MIITAIGNFGWTEEQFWDATPKSFYRAFRGSQIKEKVKWIKTAWSTSNIMNAIMGSMGSKRRVTPSQLLRSNPLFFAIEKRQGTREEYEKLKEKHKKIHEIIFREKL